MTPNANFNSDSTGPAGRLALPAFALFVLAGLLASAKQFQILPGNSDTQWPEAAFLLTAVLAVISAHSRVLPFQNVLWGALVIATLGGLAHGINALVGIPFGDLTYAVAAGPRIAGVLPWNVPLIWIVVIYSSRGMARLILNRWRESPHYGFWMMGLTTMLALVLELGLDPFASAARHYWIWGSSRLPLNWHGTPLTNFAGWLLMGGIIVLFVTPMLINKKPAPAPTERISGGVWILLNAFFLSAAWSHRQWSLVIAVGLAVFAVIILATPQPQFCRRTNRSSTGSKTCGTGFISI